MRRWPLTVRGAGALGAGVICIALAHVFHIPELVYLGALLLVAVLLALATLYLVPRTARVVRSFTPDVVAAGHEATVTVDLTVRSALPLAQGRWEDRHGEGLRAEGAGRVPSGSRERGHHILSYTIRAERRGIRDVGPLTISSTDPFGLARRATRVGDVSPLLVTPPVIDIGHSTPLPGQSGGSQQASTHQLGQGADNLIPRPYVAGDSRRRIHWRASAHRDQLMVRQEEQESAPEATVVFDRGGQRWDPAARIAPGESAPFDTALGAAVSVVFRLVLDGFRVALIDVDGSEIVAPIDGEDHAALATLPSQLTGVTAAEPTHPADLVVALGAERNGPLVIVTGDVTAGDIAAFAPLAHHSAFGVLFSVTKDPDPEQTEAVARLGASGWRAATLPVDADLGALWAAVIDEGAHRVQL